MTQAPNLLSIYDEAVHVTEQMMEAAKAQDWQSLFVLREEYEQLISRIQHVDQEATLSPDDRKARMGLIQRLVVNSATITDLTSSRLTVVKQILGKSADVNASNLVH